MSDTSELVERLRKRADEQERNNSYPVDREWDREAATALSTKDEELSRLRAIRLGQLLLCTQEVAVFLHAARKIRRKHNG